MLGNCYELHGVRIFECAAEGPALRDIQDVMTIIEQTIGNASQLIVIPLARLHPDFFDLRTRLAGEFLQKFVNYRLQVVVVGDVSPAASNSESLRAFIQESNRGGQMWFVDNVSEMERRLAQQGRSPRG